MGLLSLLKSKVSPPPAQPPGAAGDDVERARTRARQRLIGAVVLVGAGIVGFPLLFETHPRPIPVDIPIEILNKDKAPPLAMPPARTSAASAAATPPSEMITESASDAGRELPPPTEVAPERPPVVAAEPRKPEKPADKSADKSADKPATASAAAKPASSAGATAKPPGPSSDSARARALLDGQEGNKPVAKAEEAASSGGARFVVQVGAFAEANAARETRLKVEKLGLRTYTQVVDTAAGSRIRVRVGPFASRDEADRASAKLKSAGLSAALLTL